MADKSKIHSTGNWNELIFEGKNLKYGAFHLRKKYKNRALAGFLVAASLMILFVCLPAIFSLFTAKDKPAVIVELSEMTGENVQVPEPPPLLKSTSPSVNTQKTDFTNIKEKVQTDTSRSEGTEKNDGTDKNDASQNSGTGGNGQVNMEVMPSFPGGLERMNEFIKVNINYPRSEQEQRRQGVVEVGFDVKATGELSGLHIVKSISKALDDEAIRVIKMMPDWLPAYQKGKPVDNVPVKISITFKL